MSALRMDDLISAMNSINREADRALLLPPEMMRSIKENTGAGINQLATYGQSILGMRVFESPLARLPAKQHKRRRWMSAHYHYRIQKKWNKRYGTVPAAFMMSMDAFNISPIDFYRRES